MLVVVLMEREEGLVVRSNAGAQIDRIGWGRVIVDFVKAV